VENPFVYGKVARGEAFANREAEIGELVADIASSQNVIIFSPRRYGKTSLILEVLDHVKGEGLLAVYLDLFKVTSEEAFIAAYAKEIARLYRGGIRSMLRKVKNLLPRLVPQVVMKGEGSKRHLMQELFRNKNRPFYRFGKHFPLEKIPGDKFAEFIQRRFRDTGSQVTPEAIDEILKITEDHPYYTQLLSHILWTRRREEKAITEENVSQGVQEVFLREAHAFHDLWDMLPLKARQLLVALAKESSGMRLYSNDFLRKHNLGPASSVQRVVARLLEEEILEKVDGEYRYTDVFFKRWIREEFT